MYCSQCNILRRGVVCSVLDILSVFRATMISKRVPPLSSPPATGNGVIRDLVPALLSGIFVFYCFTHACYAGLLFCNCLLLVFVVGLYIFLLLHSHSCVFVKLF